MSRVPQNFGGSPEWSSGRIHGFMIAYGADVLGEAPARRVHASFVGDDLALLFGLRV